MTEKQKRVLRAPEAAAYTGLSESTLAKRRLYGQPPAFLNLSATRLMTSTRGSSRAGANPPRNRPQVVRPRSWARGFALGPAAVIRCCRVASLRTFVPMLVAGN